MTSAQHSSPEKIAIIGIGCRLPGGASEHRTYWRNLVAGKDCITDTPPDRYDVHSLRSADNAKPGRLVGGRGGYIDGFDEFDPEFFGISAREAEHMDPQQRKLLEVAWEALEDGGQKPGDLAGRDVGVFVGAFTLDYKTLQFCDLSFENLTAHTATGSMMTILSNRISYCFDFHGPSMSIDTACSSSLVAVHLACESLKRGESSLALAGGTLLHMAPQYTIAETKGGFLSPEGRSRTFDAAANGYVRAEGVAVVALKRLSDALGDNDPIHAVILSTGVNQDGRTNGITVPNPDAQVELITRVCRAADITPGDLQYMEAHGTSTPTGDPIEANAIGRALAIGRQPASPCYVGSVKANIGHSESAAGIAGLIKTALAVKHRLIPPHINLQNINPAIDLPNLPYDIPTQVTPWPKHDGPALAAVNSFGFGGTNAHVVLQQPPAPHSPAAAQPPARPHTVLPLSARNPAGLTDLVTGLRGELAGLDGSAPALRDVAYTLARRRQHLEHRLSVVYSSFEDLDEALAAHQGGHSHPRVLVDLVRDPANGAVWVFTGMGPQWWAMGRQLYHQEPTYREAVDRCDQQIRKVAGWSLVDELFADETTSQMSETWLAQPANFAVQVGLAAMWRAHGVGPAAIVGHSTGEIAAFYEAGVYSFEEAVRIVVHRSRLQQRLVGRGGMLAVGLSYDEAQQRIQAYPGRLSVAAVNSPSGVTLAGETGAIAEVAAQLSAEHVFAKQLAVRVPYHSPVMADIKDELITSLAGLQPRTPDVPLYLTGVDTPTHEQVLDAHYWWHNVRDTVRFRHAVDRLVEDGYRVFLEIGPHPVLGHSIQECAARGDVHVATVPSIRREEDERLRFALSLAALHNAGVEIGWDILHPVGMPVALPTYPWRRQRYWVEPRGMEQVRLARVDHPLLGRRLPTADPTWEVGLDTERFPYLSGHRIQGNVVFPAAGYLEMAAQAVRALTGGTEAALSQIELRKALFLPDSAASHVQLTISATDAGFRVTSTPRGGSEAVVHAAGVARAGQRADAAPPLDVDSVRARANRHLTQQQCYTALAERGYEYAGAFRAIEQVWVGRDEALARVQPAGELADGAAGHHMHPTLLDACFQSLLTPLVMDPASDSGTGVRLPLSIDEVRLHPVGNQAIWAHAVVTRRSDEEIVGDIAVYSDGGELLGRVEGFRAGNVESAGAGVGVGTIDSWLTELSWVAHTDDSADDPDGQAVADAARDWLVIADAQGFADELAAQIRHAGARCHTVRPGQHYAFDGARERSTVVAGSVEDARRLLEDLRADGWTGQTEVVHLWNLDLPTVDELSVDRLAESADAGSYSVIALAQAVAEIGGLRLHVVTRGTQQVAPGDRPEPLGAAAWGLGRVLWQQELTGQHGILLDLDPDAGHDRQAQRAEAAMLLRYAVSDREEELAFRGGRVYVSRLARAELPKPLPLRLRPDGSYLVTGAFGALGQLVCRMLAKRGARRLLLVGRTPVPERSAWQQVEPENTQAAQVRLLQELEALGVEATPVRLDVTDEGALVRWIQSRREQNLAPIRGIFHLAGQVHDRLLPEMDRETFGAAYHPKVAGAWLLHRHLSSQPLDYFVLFSSVASLLTTGGQTNYAAGNAFLDALAHHRRARGLPALSLDWGPWAIGMIRELGLVEHYRKNRGMSSLSGDAGMAVLERVLGQDRAQLLVATVVDWPTFRSWYAVAPRLIADLAQASGTADTETNDFRELFRVADEDTQAALVQQRFRALVAGILSVTTERVEPTTNLTKLGLDSLLAMELRARVLAELGVAIPVVALLGNATISELSSQLHELVAEAVGTTGEDATAGAQVELFTDETAYPLTENQKALWFLKQLHPDGFAYNIGGAVEIRAELNPELMLAAVRVLLERHPILRANYVLDRGRPVQVISPQIKHDMAVVDASGRSSDEIYQMIIAEYRKPYDLERDPLVRFRLFRRSADHWAIMKAAHHIVSDAISTFTFIEELLSIYEGLQSGTPVHLPPVAATYLDFLNWQRRLLASRPAAKMLDYWRSHLPAEIPNLSLPTDKPRPAVQTHNGASELFLLDAQLSARVHELARRHGVTPFMVLLAAYYLLLNRYSGQDDVIVGSPVSGRTQEQFASVYGYFVNPLPLHVNLSGEPTVEQLVSRVRETVLGGLDNQEYPFVLLVEQLGLQHDPSRSAVFQAMFILLTHNVSTDKYGYTLDYIDLPEEEGQFDLTLSAYESAADGQFHCVFKYNTDLFVPETIRRMSEHYVNVLDALTQAASQTPVRALDMLGTAQRTELLQDWSGLGALTAADTPVPELFARAAAEQPDALAVSVPAESGPSERMTYAELDKRSSAVATRLRALGAAEGCVVAVCLPKSADLVVTLLGVLRAGAAYLPLDPQYPPDRLGFMCQRAGAHFVVAGADDARWSAVPTLSVQHLQQPVPEPAGPVAVTGDAPAYVIFTSGSTGQPKAVQVSHASLSSAYRAWERAYRLRENVRVHLQMASPSFDVFTGDLVRALCSGGTLVLVGRDLLFNTARLHAVIRGERVDCGEFVPAVMRSLLAHCERAGTGLDPMRLVIVGSDAWKVQEYQHLRDVCGPSTRVVNSYGLTEATIDSALFEGPADGLDPNQMVPIGRPLPNSALVILDSSGRPVPPGVCGELHIAGPGLATGYVGDPEQTADRFVSLDLDEQPVRLYRTGDLARWDSHARVHLLGRMDRQIKVRGHRIEVGEIEARLTDWPGVQQSVVTVKADSRGEDLLCAYCVASADLDWRQIRRRLGEYLPTFMIPSYFARVEQLTLSSNGKVDVSALPAPRSLDDAQEGEPPATLFEVRTAEHWRVLLGVEHVALHQDFFELGGTSIKLMELIYALESEFGIDIAVSDLFKLTTLRGMAKTAENIVLGKAPGAGPYLTMNADEGPNLFCFPPAGGHGLVYRELAAHLDRQIVAFSYIGGQDMVERYADHMEAIQPTGPYAVLGYSLGGNIAFEVAQELERRGRQVADVLILDSYRITQPCELTDELLAGFEHELRAHLLQHINSDELAQETLEQAKEYIRYCNRRASRGTVQAGVTVIAEHGSARRFDAGMPGSWHGSSVMGVDVVAGGGVHAQMLSPGHVAANAAHVQAALTGEVADAA